ncbi:hypothetical protein C2G38_2211161 [Gigaspora rosea]|uniref:Uncharacterized protein n=1 Tax=Gigaspora rosea TaxID=44941 RepID=A0A397UGB0_9GLOM|nr:hypothetical protein C2G38_2211161 [Gigaspora rosea]
MLVKSRKENKRKKLTNQTTLRKRGPHAKKRVRPLYENVCKTTCEDAHKKRDHPTRMLKKQKKTLVKIKAKKIKEKNTPNKPYRPHCRNIRKLNKTTLQGRTKGHPRRRTQEILHKNGKYKDTKPKRKSKADTFDETSTTAPTTSKTKKDTSDDICDERWQLKRKSKKN